MVFPLYSFLCVDQATLIVMPFQLFINEISVTYWNFKRWLFNNTQQQKDNTDKAQNG